MGIKFSTYPTLNFRLLSKVSFGTNEENAYTFGYQREGKVCHLKTEPIGKDNLEYKLSDPRHIWNMEEYGLHLYRFYKVENYQELFGPTGIACQDATIGLALWWGSKSSTQRGVLPIGEFKKGDKSLLFQFHYEFPANQFCGKMELRTILYLKRPGHPSAEEMHLANHQGCNLGELDRFQIQIDGLGSIFPVMEVFEPEGLLWDIDYFIEDVGFDSLNESFTLKINKEHSAYHLINFESKSFVPQLFAEVNAHALMVFLMALQEDENSWETIMDAESVSSDSVARAVRYFKETHGFNFDSPITLSHSIREFLEQKATQWP